MKTLTKTFLFTIAMVFALASSYAQTRDVGNFDGVSVGGSIEVKLVKSDSPSLKYKMLQGDEENLITKVDDGVLRIKIKNSWGFGNKSAKAKIVVYYTELNEISASAGSKVLSEEVIAADRMKISCSSGASINLEIDAKKVNLGASSGGSANVSGSADMLSVGASSGGSVNAGDLISKQVDAEASSGGSVSCHASESIEADSSSGGSIDYGGNPKNKDISNNRSGSVSQRN